MIKCKLKHLNLLCAKEQVRVQHPLWRFGAELDGSLQPVAGCEHVCARAQITSLCTNTSPRVAGACANPHFYTCILPKSVNARGDVNTSPGQIQSAYPDGTLTAPCTPFPGSEGAHRPEPPEPPRLQQTPPRGGGDSRPFPVPLRSRPRDTSRGSGCPCAGGGPASSAGWKSCWPRGCALPSRRGCALPPPPLAAPGGDLGRGKG